MTDKQETLDQIGELASTARFHEQHVTMHRWRLAQTYIDLYRLLRSVCRSNAAFTQWVNDNVGTDYHQRTLFKMIDVRICYGQFGDDVVQRVNNQPQWVKLQAVIPWVTAENVHAILDICATNPLDVLKDIVRERFPLIEPLTDGKRAGCMPRL
jgi:hypothetical protein